MRKVLLLVILLLIMSINVNATELSKVIEKYEHCITELRNGSAFYNKAADAFEIKKFNKSLKLLENGNASVLMGMKNLESANLLFQGVDSQALSKVSFPDSVIYYMNLFDKNLVQNDIYWNKHIATLKEKKIKESMGLLRLSSKTINDATNNMQIAVGLLKQ